MTVGTALLAVSALVLVITWALGIDTVESNGGRVFFVVLWGFLAWSAYAGGGWVRSAITAFFVIVVWRLVNAPAVGDAIAAMTTGGTAAMTLVLAALVALLQPAAVRWFAATRRLRSEAEK